MFRRRIWTGNRPNSAASLTVKTQSPSVDDATAKKRADEFSGQIDYCSSRMQYRVDHWHGDGAETKWQTKDMY